MEVCYDRLLAATKDSSLCALNRRRLKKAGSRPLTPQKAKICRIIIEEEGMIRTWGLLQQG